MPIAAPDGEVYEPAWNARSACSVDSSIEGGRREPFATLTERHKDNTMNLMQSTAALIGLSVLASASVNTEDQPRVWLSTELMGTKVVTPDGDNVGKIDDIIVHPGGKTAYVVLSLGGWLGMGDKLYAMPWSVLREMEPVVGTTTREVPRQLVLPMPKEKFGKAPAFDKKTWPDTSRPEWAQDIDAFYTSDLNPASKRVVEAGVHNSALTWRASELKGTNVVTPQGDKLGDLEEFAIDSNGRVCYASLSVGGFLGIGDRHVAVPWDTLRFSLGGDDNDKKVITLSSTKEQLERAPQFKSAADARAQMRDPKWVQGVYQHYSAPEYWKASRDTTTEPRPAPRSEPKK